MPQQIPLGTLIEFLQGSGARPQPFDLGRRLVPLGSEQFLGFERTEQPYPYPLDRQAWFSLLLQQPDGDHLLWFLRFPLDEQGKLIQAARDDFMQRLLERLGDNMNPAESGDQAVLQDSPYSFKPRQDRMAVIHALAARLTGNPESKFYQHARDYFAGRLGWDQWPFVGYQGIADIACRLDQADNETLLANAIPQLPARPFTALCECLENVAVGDELAGSIVERARQALHPLNPPLLAAAIRGSGLARNRALSRRLVQQVLAQPAADDPGVLAAISGRAWEALVEPALAAAYLGRLAAAGQAFFDQCLSDLLFLPGMRQPLLQALRSPARPERLSKRIGSFFRSAGVKGPLQ